jgi:hypothetical protein
LCRLSGARDCCCLGCLLQVRVQLHTNPPIKCCWCPLSIRPFDIDFFYCQSIRDGGVHGLAVSSVDADIAQNMHTHYCRSAAFLGCCFGLLFAYLYDPSFSCHALPLGLTTNLRSSLEIPQQYFQTHSCYEAFVGMKMVKRSQPLP